MEESREINEKKINGNNRVIVALLTPYLAETIDDMEKDGRSKEYIQNQIEKYGYNQNNFEGVKYLETPKRVVRLETVDDHESKGPCDVNLAIQGSTENGERQVSGFKGTGLIVARYSIFYGGPSNYTGNYPEDAGYSLDFPKKVEAVKAFLTDDNVLDAIVAREEDKIRDAIDSLNKKLEKPVLVTPYLAEALKARRCK